MACGSTSISNNSVLSGLSLVLNKRMVSSKEEKTCSLIRTSFRSESSKTAWSLQTNDTVAMFKYITTSNKPQLV